MNRIAIILVGFFALLSCDEESSLSYSETNITSEEFAIIEINIPKVVGSSDVANKMNTAISAFVANGILAGQEPNNSVSIEDAIAGFNDNFRSFSETITDAIQPWEAFVDGEVTFNSSELVSIAMNVYLNTGGIHGNSVISFLNFDPATGKRYSNLDVIDNLDLVKPLIEEHFKKAVIAESNGNDQVTDFNFKLPETIGFSEDGVIVVYNQHELEGLSMKLLEFTIPYAELTEYLPFNL